ncbi:hypothetical protein [Sphingobacterium deserti]|uniref:Lipoprotein n=1 Tax=Sphingobacterium deserti TaxID=1229276 RepID=A0A0B8T5M7_9SPHI|nr:hypothetical protein [Sphingobacterium deserti]KGE12999.1 hypothetical protein DI53_3216 [Sphingobacterium deserti]
MKIVKRILPLLIAFFGCSLLTGCFDLVEQIDMKRNGSGTIKATLNLSKSKTKVASLMRLKSVNGITIPTEATVKKEMENAVKTLRTTNGISNVQYSLDFTNYIATLSCDFKSIQALNEFSSTLSKQFKVKLTSYNSYAFNPSAQVFSRNYTYSPDIAKQFARIPNDDRQLFKDAYYTNIIRFESAVKSQVNKSAKVASNSKAVLLKIPATNLINGSTSIANTITLTK